MKKLIKSFRSLTSDEKFKHLIEVVEVLVAKLLSLLMILVIFAALGDLAIFIVKQIIYPTEKIFGETLFSIFGLFLNVLIALEILENITGYLKKHVLQIELVIVTSLIAIARKIIILDLKATEGIQIIGLGIAILSLSISYFIIRSSNYEK
ncbi:phosphate-starvation-inducible PsiE family protein [Cronbergia sp. UHCC 0137]|uniref:phosphate-starvation-inducible PsiE family protein n=1 Tax=Cronbergia sp. UHCC 0137 TaxID=3110239 RepID=UPI002B202A4B|nr:phosphate-starvation-inducible PsiE family protein [Cronbergia sp. UHCC 0137]MEA5618316.1 phosphate-starvation-inducible PsiE family protein [Cronbergia sp. UHCC 0137]